MVKYILLLFLFLFSIPLASAINITAGVENNIHTIEKCDGPITIKVTSEEGIGDDELFLKDCDKINNNKWDCYCDDSFNLVLNTKNDTFNMFDFTIEYFVDFKNYIVGGDREPSLKEIEYENTVRTDKIIDVLVKPQEKQRVKFNLDIESKNAIIVGTLIAFFIIVVIFMKGRSALDFTKKENNDVLNYRTTKDDELDDIFNRIK